MNKLKKKYCKVCGKQIAYCAKNYCMECILSNPPLHKRFKHGKCTKIHKCIICKEILSDFRHKKCCKCQGESSRIHAIKYCKICKKKLSSYQCKTGYCKKCYYTVSDIWNKGKKIGNLKCKHHLDLNKKNNKRYNLLKLTNSQHQLFHRLTYHYLFEKFGIKEILKYEKWFFKRIK
jgi:hypothetical protein